MGLPLVGVHCELNQAPVLLSAASWDGCDPDELQVDHGRLPTDSTFGQVAAHSEQRVGLHPCRPGGARVAEDVLTNVGTRGRTDVTSLPWQHVPGKVDVVVGPGRVEVDVTVEVHGGHEARTRPPYSGVGSP